MSFDKQLYESGLTAQGSYDSMDQYDKEAILRFAELIVQECLDQCYYRGMNNATRQSLSVACL